MHVSPVMLVHDAFACTSLFKVASEHDELENSQRISSLDMVGRSSVSVVLHSITWTP